jgi:superfamily II DNA or RNA helicase
MSLIDIVQGRKEAALLPEVELQPQQERVVERLRHEPALLAYHALGSGKTLASIAAGEELEGPKTVVVPAALRENYAKELGKFTDVQPDHEGYDIRSYNKAVAKGMPEAALTIFDEAHRMGRPGTQVSKLPEEAHGKVLFLTGTPVRNDPSEIVPLLKVLAQGRNPPGTHKAFRDKFIEQVVVQPSWWQRTWHGAKPGMVERLRNQRDLRRLVKGRVDYHPLQGEFPRVEEEDVTVEMTPRQHQLYEAFLAEDEGLAYKVKRNLPPSKTEATQLNAFLSAVRQLSNNPQAFDKTLTGSPVAHSPKLRRMLGEIYRGLENDPNFKAVVYSNYLESGIMPLAEALARKKVPAAIFTGGLDDADRRQIVSDYNDGKTKVLLVSSAGSEGLDLKGTKLMQLMEPHWNQTRLDQMAGRAIRHKSHSHLPESERVVKVQRFFSDPPRTFAQRIGLTEADTGADRYMANLSENKQRLLDQFLNVLQQEGSRKAAAAEDYAEGLPDPERFGQAADIPVGKLLQYVVQRHEAERAGLHHDVRFGEFGPASDLYSWATKKELPEPGGRIMLYRQPIHKGQYADFEGMLHSGYGKGVVKTKDRGTVVVTHADENKIKFVMTHRKFPEYFTMIRYSGPPSQPRTEREAKTQGGSWLLINTTPTSAAKFLGGEPEEVGLNKLKYTKIPAEKVNKLFDSNYLVQEKLDGSSALIHLLGDKIEAVSYRVSKTGRPLIHTFRVFGPGGDKTSVQLPEELKGTILRGEIFGQRGEKVIPPQELGGILNASIQNALQKQKETGTELKVMPFDVVRWGKEPVAPFSLSAQERMTRLKEIAKYLPESKFRLPETAETPEAAKSLFEAIKSRQHPRTSEGIVGWPKEPGKPPIKVKLFPEADVWVRNVFPGEGRLTGTGAGGFEYSLTPEGPVVGKVGTGFSDEVRRAMLADQSGWVGRMARIRAQEKFPSGAYRAPAFLALHEDYPMRVEAPAELQKAAKVWASVPNPFGKGDLITLGEEEPTHPQMTEEEIAQAIAEGRETLRKRFNVTPFLTGSMATGVAVPGHVDLDFTVPLKSKEKMLRLARRLRSNPEFQTSPYHPESSAHQVFTWKRFGKLPVDIALSYGEKAQKYKEAVRAAAGKLPPETQQEIRDEKARLQKAVFLRQVRYARYKREVEEKLGILPYRLKDEPLEKASADETAPEAPDETQALQERIRRMLASQLGFAHRTTNLEPLLQSGRQLTAEEAARKGLLRSVEAVKGIRGRERFDPARHANLRRELFGTEGGVMPPGPDYGKYGIIRYSRSKVPSPYINMVPGEVLSPRNTGLRSAVFLVPRKEVPFWREKHPELRFLANEDVPADLVLPNRELSHLPVRAFRQVVNLLTLQPTSLVG